MYSYNGLAHRHAPEIALLAQAATGVAADIAFVPHSGPFARGIHATVQATLRRPMSTEDVIAGIRQFYAGSRFVRVLHTPPRITWAPASFIASEVS